MLQFFFTFLCNPFDSLHPFPKETSTSLLKPWKMLSESPNLTLIDSSLELAVYGHGSYLGFFVDQEEEQGTSLSRPSLSDLEFMKVSKILS
ncbi:hypothetical protein F8388_015346 [Cannabis sativa]|uniref:Uncharacterized protein n=1 Tax=Cannabis sativa TaxID=3483 RepID=A0A7J6HI04_CANSA|nr:hypothetical protein F8388_015346 [Cannabis sativa]KAF4394328.1 hypothetical protein G4B88_018478 [Cannabis sativa]